MAGPLLSSYAPSDARSDTVRRPTRIGPGVGLANDGDVCLCVGCVVWWWVGGRWLKGPEDWLD